MKTIIITLIIVGLSSGFVITSNIANKAKTDGVEKISSQTKVTAVITAVTVEEPGIPLRLQIPALNVDAGIESVGLDAQNRMDVPVNPDNAAWFAPGFKPGSRGSAVLAGHYDKATGEPAIFWNITNLTPSDKIIVTDANNKSYTFVVTHINTFPYDQFPLDEVFANSNQPGLNLITCTGEWNEISQNYSQRTVVYSELEQ